MWYGKFIFILLTISYENKLMMLNVGMEIERRRVQENIIVFFENIPTTEK
jgi:hypothetical protein